MFGPKVEDNAASAIIKILDIIRQKSQHILSLCLSLGVSKQKFPRRKPSNLKFKLWLNLSTLSAMLGLKVQYLFCLSLHGVSIVHGSMKNEFACTFAKLYVNK